MSVLDASCVDVIMSGVIVQRLVASACASPPQYQMLMTGSISNSRPFSKSGCCLRKSRKTSLKSLLLYVSKSTDFFCLCLNSC